MLVLATPKHFFVFRAWRKQHTPVEAIFVLPAWRAKKQIPHEAYFCAANFAHSNQSPIEDGVVCQAWRAKCRFLSRLNFVRRAWNARKKPSPIETPLCMASLVHKKTILAETPSWAFSFKLSGQKAGSCVGDFRGSGLARQKQIPIEAPF